MAHNTADEMIRHYTAADEASRLRTGWFQLEQARTHELILRHLQPAPATVLDVGGAAGAYACWLASRGYRVHLVDPVPNHVEQALAAMKVAPVLTVTDEATHPADRGIVSFVIDANHVRFDIDKAAAAQSGLVISSKLLGLAHNVKPRTTEGSGG